MNTGYPNVFDGPEMIAPHSPEQQSALVDVLYERQEQNIKWGEQNHPIEWWLAILGEEFGELCQCALHKNFGGYKAAELRDEAVQVAAVALAIVECLDRNGN